MGVALPYEFDTGAVPRTILKGVFAIEAMLVVLGLLTPLTQENALVAWAFVLGISLILIPLGTFIFRKLEGSSGIITASTVFVRPTTLLGIRCDGPSGDFAADQFQAIRVELCTFGQFSEAALGSAHYERVYLVGHAGAPDVLVARTQNERGREIGRDLGALLKLPVYAERRPY